MSKFNRKGRKRAPKVQYSHIDVHVKKPCGSTLEPSMSLNSTDQIVNTDNTNKHLKRSISSTDTNGNKRLATNSSFGYIDENIQIIWLDIKTNDSLVHQARLHLISNYLKLFDNVDAFIGYILSLNSDKKTKIILVLSAVQGRQIVPLVYERSQVFSIYIFCVNEKKDEEWIQFYSDKIKGVFIDIHDLIAQLDEDIIFYSKTISMNIKPSFHFDIEHISFTNLNNEQSSFIWYQLLIDALKHLPSTSVGQKNLLTDCQLEHSNFNIELHEIQEFKEIYNSENVIACYTRDTFIYRLLDKALRTKDISVILKFRFVLIDLHDHLSQFHDTCIDSLKSQNLTMSELIVFHGQGLTFIELENLKTNINNRIAVNNFLFASTSRDIALYSAGNGLGRPIIESVLFEIHCPIKNYIRKSFASIQQYIPLNSTNEILFKIGTIFDIDFVEKLTEQIWRVKLTLCNDDNDSIFNKLVNSLKSNNENTLDISPLADLLLNMNEIGKAKCFYETILRNLPFDHYDRINVKNKIGKIYLSKGNYLIALKHFKIALKINRKLRPQEFNSIASILNNIGNVYKELCKYSQSIKYYRRALRIQKMILMNNDLELATTFNNLGIVYMCLSNYNLALKYHIKAKRIRISCLPKTNLDLSETLVNIGETYFSKGYLKIARIQLEKGLDIKLKFMTADHPSLAIIYTNLACVYGQLGNFQKAFEHNKRSLDISLKSIENNHPNQAQIYSTIAQCYNRLDDSNAALFYHKKALKIRLKSLPIGHLDTIRSYIQIGIVYRYKKRYKLALKYLKKGLAQLSPSLNKSLLIFTYYQLGKLYVDKSNSKMVIKYYKKAIGLQQKCEKPATSSSLAEIYISFGEFYLKNNDTTNALIQIKKALRIGENYLNFDDSTIRKVIPVIVQIFQKKKHYAAAFKYARRLLNIQQKDPTTAANVLAETYFDIASIYSTKDNHQKAILNYQRALKYLRKADSQLSSLNMAIVNLIYFDLGRIYADKLDYRMAIKYLNKTIEYRLQHDESNIDHNLAVNYILLGQVYLKNDDTMNALVQFLKALEIEENRPKFDNETIQLVLSNIVQVFRIRKDYKTALEYAMRLLNIQQKDPAIAMENLVTTYFDVGYIYYCMHNNEKAISYYRKALKYVSSENSTQDQVYYGLALIYDDEQNRKAARENYKNVLKFCSNNIDLLGSAYNNIGVIDFFQRKYDVARSKFLMAIEINETDLELASTVFYNIAVIDHFEKDYESALEHYRMALEIMEESEVKNEDLLIKIYKNMGGIYNLISNYDEQLNCYEQVLNFELNSNKRFQNYETIATAYRNLGVIYFRHCNYSAALQNFENSLTTASKSMTNDNPYIAEYHNYISLTKNYMQSKGIVNISIY